MPAVPTSWASTSTPAKAPGTDPGPTLFASAQKEGSTVKTSDTAKSPSPSSVPGKKAPSTSDFFKKCALSFGTAAWLEMGCAGAQVRPEPGDCPKGAAQAMADLELYKGEILSAWIDASQPQLEAGEVERGVRGVYRSGPIVSRTAHQYRPGHKLPVGTLLYGQLWMNEKERVAYGRWTEAELPGSRKRVPVCLILASSRGDGYKWSEGSTPEAVRLPKEVVFQVVHRWP